MIKEAIVKIVNKEDLSYQEAYDVESPAGEYIVLAFNDNGEEVRYEFPLVDGGEDLVREARMVGDEEMETMYRATCKDGENKTTIGVMREWVNDLLEGDD